MQIRLFFIFWLACFSLTSCVYYGDIHGHSKPLSLADLAIKQVYPIANKKTVANWWDRFHDPLLSQLINTALADAPDMQIAAARARRAQRLVDSAIVPLWPTMDFSGYVQRERFSEFGLIPPPFNGRTYNIGELGFNLEYDFDFWGKNRQLLASRISEKCAAEAEVASARLIISAAVANTYFQLLNTIAQEKLAKENLQIVKETMNIVVDRAAHGIESDVPVKTALVNVQAATLSVEQLKQAEMLNRNQLAILLGKNPVVTEIMTPSFVYHERDVTLPIPLSANLLANRPDIYAAKLRAEAAAHQINVAKARFFPDINLAAIFSYQSVGLGHLFDVADQNNAITGAIDLPIFDAGLRRANLGAKYAEYDLAVTSYNQALLTGLKEVADQLAILKSLKAQLSAQDDALKATKHNYQLFNSRYHHGIVDAVQLFEIKQLVLQYQATQLNLQTSHLQAVVAMWKALGGNGMS